METDTWGREERREREKAASVMLNTEMERKEKKWRRAVSIVREAGRQIFHFKINYISVQKDFGLRI